MKLCWNSGVAPRFWRWEVQFRERFCLTPHFLYTWRVQQQNIAVFITSIITVKHGSAYIVVRSTSQSYGDSNFFFFGGEQNPKTKTLNRLTKNLAWVITLAMTPCIPKFKTNAPLGTWWHMREICDPRVVFSFPILSYFLWLQILLASPD